MTSAYKEMSNGEACKILRHVHYLSRITDQELIAHFFKDIDIITPSTGLPPEHTVILRRTDQAHAYAPAPLPGELMRYIYYPAGNDQILTAILIPGSLKAMDTEQKMTWGRFSLGIVIGIHAKPKELTFPWAFEHDNQPLSYELSAMMACRIRITVAEERERKRYDRK